MIRPILVQVGQRWRLPKWVFQDDRERPLVEVAALELLVVPNKGVHPAVLVRDLRDGMTMSLPAVVFAQAELEALTA